MQQISLVGFFEWETTVYFCPLFVHFKPLLTTLTNSAMMRLFQFQLTFWDVMLVCKLESKWRASVGNQSNSCRDRPLQSSAIAIHIPPFLPNWDPRLGRNLWMPGELSSATRLQLTTSRGFWWSQSSYVKLEMSFPIVDGAGHGWHCQKPNKGVGASALLYPLGRLACTLVILRKASLKKYILCRIQIKWWSKTWLTWLEPQEELGASGSGGE